MDVDIFLEWLRKNQDPSLAFKLQKQWSSTYTDNRLLIRRDLYKALKHKSVLDLSKPPRVPDKNISVSHCPVMGGYVLSDRLIGIDLEQFRRISLKLVERILGKEEEKFIQDFPHQLFWTIKESAYKALHLQNLPVSEIKVTKIEKLNSELEIAIYKSECRVKGQKTVNYSLISESQDVCCSLSYDGG